MTCMETQEQASRFIDGELSEQERGSMFGHLASCPDCQEFFSDSLRLRSGIGEEKEAMRTPVPTWDQAKAKIVSSAPSSTSRLRWIQSRRVSLPLPIAAVIAFFLIVASAVVTFSTTEGGREPAPKEVILISLPIVEVQGYRLPNQPIQQ